MTSFKLTKGRLDASLLIPFFQGHPELAQTGPQAGWSACEMASECHASIAKFMAPAHHR